MRILPFLLLTFYFSLAPIYWLPHVPIAVLNAVKLSAFGAAIALSWIILISQRSWSFPRGMLGLGGLLLLFVCGVPAFYMARDFYVMGHRAADICLGYVTLWTYFNIVKSGKTGVWIITFPAFVIAGASLMTISARLAGFPAFITPTEYGGNPLWISGFGSLRTGWSIGIGIYIAILMAMFGTADPKTSKKLKLVYLLAVVCIIGSQVVVGGRAGLLSSLTMLLLYGMSRGRRPLLLVVFISLGAFTFALADYLIIQLRLDRILNSDYSFQAFNNFSAGRLGSFVQSLKWIGERPLFGYGFGNVNFETYNGIHEIHNVWLRMAAEGGVLFPLALVVIVTALQLAMARGHRMVTSGRFVGGAREHLFAEAGYYALPAGIVASLFEPNVLLGAFQVSAVWWALVGAGLGAVAKVNLGSNARVRATPPRIMHRSFEPTRT